MGSFVGPTGQPIELGTPTGVPGPNFGAQAAAITKGVKDAGGFHSFWHWWWTSVSEGIPIVVRALVTGFQDMMTIVLIIVGLLEGGEAASFYNLVGQILTNLLGVTVHPSVAQWGVADVGAREGNISVGQSFYSVLTRLIAPSVPLTPEGGLGAAQSFLGFLIGYAVREGNIDFIASFLPEEYRLLDGFKEYGPAVARALGLGRMARLAVTPLMNILIADPLKWYLNRTYRPTLMNEAQLVRSNLRGLTLTPDYATQLSWLGWSDANIAALVEDTVARLPVADLWTLHKFGEIEEDQLRQYVMHTGTDQVNAQLMMDAEADKEQEPDVEAQLQHFVQMRQTRVIDSQTFAQMIQVPGISPARQQSLISRTSTIAETPLRRATLADYRTAYISGLVDLSEFEQYLLNEGYLPSEAQLLLVLELQKSVEHSAQVAVAQYKYNKAVAAAQKKGEPIPPKPAILQ